MGERLESAGFAVLALLLGASYSKEKVELLNRANVKLEQARYYVRLCKDMKLVNLHHYEVISKMLNGIGVQLGGWIKQQRQRV